MSPLLGLDVQNEVHIEPRYPVYDAVLQFNRFGNSQLAKELVSHLQVGASTRRLSALHRLEGTNVAHVPACTHCQAEMSRSHADLLGNPNGRLQSSLPACGACLGLSRLQLVGVCCVAVYTKRDHYLYVDNGEVLSAAVPASKTVSLVVSNVAVGDSLRKQAVH